MRRCRRFGRHRAITAASFFAIKTSVNEGSGGLDIREEELVLKKIYKGAQNYLKADWFYADETD